MQFDREEREALLDALVEVLERGEDPAAFLRSPKAGKGMLGLRSLGP
ncbi:MAG TPA: hypothetical protein VF339_16660 [Gammaproteobacteria bacterium]